MIKRFLLIMALILSAAGPALALDPWTPAPLTYDRDYLEQFFARTAYVDGSDSVIFSNLGTHETAINSKLTAAGVTGSVTLDNGRVALLNDSTAPGNRAIYGTNTAGVRGWYLGNAAFAPGVINFYFVGAGNGNGETVPYVEKDGAGTYTVSNFIFEGSNYFGTPTEFATGAYVTTTGGVGNKIQWYDLTNNSIIAEITVSTTTPANIQTTTTFINQPSAARSLNAIRIIIPATNGRIVRLNSTQIKYF